MIFSMLLVPFRLLFGTAKVSAKAGYKTAKTSAVVGAKTAKGSAKAGYTAGRAVGYGRTAVFAAGIAVGVLAASPKAREAAGRLGSTLWGAAQTAKGLSDGDIAEQVRRRLAGSQATWHLDQPKVVVQDGLVRLEGDAPDAAARRAIGETASEVDGVREVDNRVSVTPVGSGNGSSSDAAHGSTAAVGSAATTDQN